MMHRMPKAQVRKQPAGGVGTSGSACRLCLLGVRCSSISVQVVVVFYRLFFASGHECLGPRCCRVELDKVLDVEA